MLWNACRTTFAVSALVVGAAAALAGCGAEVNRDGTGRPVVAATAPQLDGLTRALAVGGVTVGSVVAATADLHDVELRPSQVRVLQGAALILRPGRGNDAWAQEALSRVDGTQLDVSKGLPGDERHWWMDPVMAGDAAMTIATELDRLDPDGKFKRGAALKRLLLELRSIDADTKRCLATVPAGNRVIVTDHDAAGAYAARYGLTVAGTIAPGADPEAAPSAQRVVELISTMKADGVQAVFPIAPHGSELSKTIAQRGGAVLGQPLWADALPAGDPTVTAAAELNGRAVAVALGAAPAACRSLLS